MFNRIKKFLCAALLGGALIFGSGAVEAGIVTDRLPLTCYVDHRVNTYNSPNAGAVGYISANVDLIQVTQIRPDGWAYGSYPGKSGRVSRWFRISDLCADVNYSNRSVNVNGAQNVYRTSASSDTIGSVSNNESVVVIADNGNRAQIVYRLNNGTGYKMGWVPSSSVAARNIQSNVQSVVRYATLNDGWYKISPLHAPGRLLDVNAASTAVGANIQLWDDASNVSQPNQVFYLKNLGNNWFTLKAGHCDLNVAAANTSGSLRTNIQLASPNANSAAQRWRLVYSTTNGAYYIESAIKDKLAFDCADTGSTNGTNIWLWEYGDVNWNKWRFTPVRAPQVNPTPVSGLKGDVNGDGKVDKTDIEALQKYMVDLPVSINKSNADMNNDGNINAVDLSQLVSKVNSNPSPTPVPTQQRAEQTVPAFTDSGLSQRTGNERVDAGDMVTVLQETNNAYKVRYPTSNGTKDRWVSKDIFIPPPPINAKLQSLINTWRGKSWDPYGKNQNSYWPTGEKATGWQCFGFANYIFKELHGVICGKSVGSSHIVSDTSAGVRCRYTTQNSNQDAIHRELQSNISPGDLIQGTNGRQHTMIFVSYDANTRTLRLFDANFADPPDNMIRDRPMTLANFVKRFPRVSFYTK